MKSEEKPINYIMHIPKTAGMSLQGLVIRRHKNPNTIELVYDEPSRKKGFVDKPELRTVMGHFRYGYHKFSNRPANYFTFLRDPIEHVISSYQYSIDYPEKFGNIPDGINNIIAFAKCPYGFNIQTKYITGIEKVENEPNIISIAKEHLESKIKLIGLTEDFDTSLLMMGKILNWPILTYLKKNKGISRTKQPRPDQETLNELKAILIYDIALYEFAQGLYEKQKAKFKIGKFQLIRFRIVNRIFQVLNPSYIKLKVLLGKA